MNLLYGFIVQYITVVSPAVHLQKLAQYVAEKTTISYGYQYLC